YAASGARRHRRGDPGAAGRWQSPGRNRHRRLHASALRTRAGPRRGGNLAALPARGGMTDAAAALPDPVLLAIPAFVALAVLEVLVARWRRHRAYELQDTAASLTMGLVNLVQGIAFAGLIWWGLQVAYQW